MKYLFVSFESDSWPLYELAKRYQQEGHTCALLQGDIWSLTDGRDLFEFLQQSPVTYYHLEEEYRTLNEPNDVSPDMNVLKSFEQQYLRPERTLSRIVQGDPRNSIFAYREHYQEPDRDRRYYWYELVIKKLLQLFDEYDPDVICTLKNNYLIKNLTYEIATEKQIPYLSLHSARIRNYSIVSDNFLKTTASYIREDMPRIGDENREEARAIVAEIKDQRQLSYNRDRQNTLLENLQSGPVDKLKTVAWKTRHLLRSAVTRHHFQNDGPDVFSSRPWGAWKWWLKRVWKKGLYADDDLFVRDVDKDQDYIYWPLHFIPESSVFTTFDSVPDEEALIKDVSLKLPVGVQLYIKENRNMCGTRPERFYRHLDRIPQVTFVHPGVHSIDLIADAEAVISFTGTALLEAAFFNKKGIAIGKPDFDVLYNIVHYEGGQLPDLTSPDRESNLLPYLQTVLKWGEEVDVSGMRSRNVEDFDRQLHEEDISHMKQVFDRYLTKL